MRTKTLELMYDEEGDILYVHFLRERKAAYQSLIDNIVLRFDPHTLEPIGLTIIDFSVLAPLNAMAPSFELYRLANISPERRQKVLSILTSSPVNHWLTISADPVKPDTWIGSISQPQTILHLLNAA